MKVRRYFVKLLARVEIRLGIPTGPLRRFLRVSVTDSARFRACQDNGLVEVGCDDSPPCGFRHWERAGERSCEDVRASLESADIRRMRHYQVEGFLNLASLLGDDLEALRSLRVETEFINRFPEVLAQQLVNRTEVAANVRDFLVANGLGWTVANLLFAWQAVFPRLQITRVSRFWYWFDEKLPCST